MNAKTVAKTRRLDDETIRSNSMGTSAETPMSTGTHRSRDSPADARPKGNDMKDQNIELPPLPSRHAVYRDPAPTECGLYREPDYDVFTADQMQDYARTAIEADRKRRGEPVVGERFVRAWINLAEFPGGMMIGPEGKFGPVAASTSCWITTSEKEAERLKAKGPVLEIWTSPQPASSAEPIGEVAGQYMGAYSIGNIFFPKNGPLPSGTKLYAAPQPADPVIRESRTTAEPVKMLSDAEDDIVDLLSEHADHNTEHGRMSFDKWALREAVSALLARYGQPAQPVVSDWPTINDANPEAIRVLLDERDALIHDNSEYVSAANELATENQRLRVELVRAVAMGLAEIERIDRAAMKETKP